MKGLTGAPERIWQAAMRPNTLLELLRTTSPEYFGTLGPELRQFACWCARDAGAASRSVPVHRVLHTAERYAAGEATAALLAAERRAVSGIASMTMKHGLPRRLPGAAAELAAIRAADEDPFEAALWASHYAALAAVLKDGEHAGVTARLRQASALRFFVPNPFVPEDRRADAVA